jgi:hypothetical protein
MNKWLKQMFLYAPDDTSTGVALDEPVISEDDIDLEKLLADDLETPDETPASPEMVTQTDLNNALQSFQTTLLEAIKPKEEPKGEPEPAPAPVIPQGQILDASMIVRLTQQTMSDMRADIRANYPDVPEKIMARIEQELNMFQTVEALADAKAKKYHTQIADSVIAAAARSGDYRPSAFGMKMPTGGGLSPTAVTPAAPVFRGTKADADAIAKVNRTLEAMGVGKLTADDIKESQKHFERVGSFG